MARAMKEPAPREVAPDFTIITGLSGAGRSEAAKVLEDLGYFVIDNLPPALIGKMAELASQPTSPLEHIALVVDVRGGQFFPELAEALAELGRRGVGHRIVFLEASDESLIRRFEHTRRKHPLADRITEGISRERTLLRSLRGSADLVIDTSDLTVHELRDRIRNAFASDERRESRMQVTVVSFGYKFGVPLDSDIVIDVRFLPNPHWVESLRPLPGTDPRIREYVLSQPATKEFLDRFEQLLDVTIPGYLAEGKHYLTIGVGCTGGRHRSVVIGERVAAMLRERGLRLSVEHRDIDQS
ncbi:MAG: RNase adapter RapZ [Actinobacteria bacterium]|nr:RNase adapter RapZ [Actinomycetota bacterium]